MEMRQGNRKLRIYNPNDKDTRYFESSTIYSNIIMKNIDDVMDLLWSFEFSVMRFLGVSNQICN